MNNNHINTLLKISAGETVPESEVFDAKIARAEKNIRDLREFTEILFDHCVSLNERLKVLEGKPT